MSRILEGERVAEVEVRVLLSSLVIGTVSFQERNDLVEAGELHAILISMHMTYAERDPRVVRLDVIALGVTIEVADLREHVTVIEAKTPVSNEREDNFLPVDTVLVTIGIGQRPGVHFAVKLSSGA